MPGWRGLRRQEDAEPALAEYGLNLGIAFQLVDDALDYAADEAALGKTVGDDFREGKVTMPVLIAYRRGDAAERAFWERTIGRTEQRYGDLSTAMGLMSGRDAIGGTLNRANVLCPTGPRGADRVSGLADPACVLAVSPTSPSAGRTNGAGRVPVCRHHRSGGHETRAADRGGGSGGRRRPGVR